MEQLPPGWFQADILGQDRGTSFSPLCRVGDCSAPPMSKRRSRPGPNSHAVCTHHCGNGLIARDGHRKRHTAKWKRLVCSLPVNAPDAPGVQTRMERAGEREGVPLAGKQCGHPGRVHRRSRRKVGDGCVLCTSTEQPLLAQIGPRFPAVTQCGFPTPENVRPPFLVGLLVGADPFELRGPGGVRFVTVLDQA